MFTFYTDELKIMGMSKKVTDFFMFIRKASFILYEKPGGDILVLKAELKR